MFTGICHLLNVLLDATQQVRTENPTTIIKTPPNMDAKSLLVHLGKAVTQRKLKLKQHLKHLGIYIWQSWPSLHTFADENI